MIFYENISFLQQVFGDKKIGISLFCGENLVFMRKRHVVIIFIFYFELYVCETRFFKVLY